MTPQDSPRDERGGLWQQLASQVTFVRAHEVLEQLGHGVRVNLNPNPNPNPNLNSTPNPNPNPNLTPNQVLEQLERGAVADLQLELAGLVAERMDLQAGHACSPRHVHVYRVPRSSRRRALRRACGAGALCSGRRATVVRRWPVLTRRCRPNPNPSPNPNPNANANPNANPNSNPDAALQAAAQAEDADALAAHE
eukprot:scaffold21789_cov45-Phaeocystis_antarctica.AAC.1